MIFIKGKIDCCKSDCPDRAIGCHSTCPRYATQKESANRERELTTKVMEKEYDYIRYRVKHREIADY